MHVLPQQLDQSMLLLLWLSSNLTCSNFLAAQSAQAENSAKKQLLKQAERKLKELQSNSANQGVVGEGGASKAGKTLPLP